MNIQPEFDVASIINKISIAEPGGKKASRESLPANPFSTLFEAALQDIDDPQLAETIAALNESGTIMPLSNEISSFEEGFDMEFGLLEMSKESPAFQAIQLMNGRSIITSRASAAASGVSLAMENSSPQAHKGGEIDYLRSALRSDVIENPGLGTETQGSTYIGRVPLTPNREVISEQEIYRPLGEGTDNSIFTVEGNGYRAKQDIQDTEDYRKLSDKFHFTQDTNKGTGVSDSSLFKQDKTETFGNSVLGISRPRTESAVFEGLQNVENHSIDKVSNEIPLNRLLDLDNNRKPAMNVQGNQEIKEDLALENIQGVKPGLKSGNIPETKVDPTSKNISGNMAGMLAVKKLDVSAGTTEELSFSSSDKGISMIDSRPVLVNEKISGARNSRVGNVRQKIESENTQESAIKRLIGGSDSLSFDENTMNPPDSFSSSDLGAGDFSGQSSIESSYRVLSGRNDIDFMRAPVNTPERWVNVNDFQHEFNGVVKNALLERDQSSGETTLKVMLNPDSMGEIEVEIIEKNNTVTVNLVAQNEEVVKLLRDNVPVLKEVLGANSIFELNVSRDGNEPGEKYSQRENSSHHFNSQEKTGASGSEIEEGSYSTTKSAHKKALDIYL